MSTCLNLQNNKRQQTISKGNKNYLRSTRGIYLSPYLLFYSQMRNLQSSQGKHWPGLEVLYWSKAAATPGKDIKALLRGQLSCTSTSGLELYVCFSLKDKCFFPKPVLIALVSCCLKRAFLWKPRSLQLPRSYRRFKPSELSVLARRAQGVQPWQTLFPAERHQFSMQNPPWAPLTCKPARPTQKELQTQIKFTKDYSCIYCLP